jgi:hypothetical protein
MARRVDIKVAAQVKRPGKGTSHTGRSEAERRANEREPANPFPERNQGSVPLASANTKGTSRQDSAEALAIRARDTLEISAPVSFSKEADQLVDVPGITTAFRFKVRRRAKGRQESATRETSKRDDAPSMTRAKDIVEIST